MYKKNTTKDIAELVISAMQHSHTHTITADDDPERIASMIDHLLDAPLPEYPGDEFLLMQQQQEEE